MMVDGNNEGVNALRGAYADDCNDGLQLLRDMDLSAFCSGNWKFHYDAIAGANRTYYLANESSLSTERKDYYRGVSCFFKAFIYLNILQEWGDCVLVKDDIIVGPVAKSPWTQVIDYAIEQAKEAVKLLPEWDELKDSNGNSPKHRSVACRGAANAVLAYLCAWKAGGKYFALPEERNYDETELWQMAEKACTEVIKSSAYELASTPEEICTSVLVGGSREGIFETVYKDMWTEMQGGWDAKMLKFTLFYYYVTWPLDPIRQPNSIQYRDLRIKNESIRKMFSDNDLRRDAYFYKFETMAHPDSIRITGGYAFPYKWRKPLLGTDIDNLGELYNTNQNKIWFRLTDVYLLRAECRARLGGEYIAGAIDDLNKIRERAKAKLYDAAEYNGDLRYTIFKEREKELIMEEFRYYDIIRNGYARQELGEGFKKLSDQDFVEGAFFRALGGGQIGVDAFYRNPLMRQNTFWLRRL